AGLKNPAENFNSAEQVKAEQAGEVGDVLDRICTDVEREYQMSGLSDGLYGDYAQKVARRFAALRPAPQSEPAQEAVAWTNATQLEYLKEDGEAQMFSAPEGRGDDAPLLDRKSTRLNSSHVKISYAVFCLKKKKNTHKQRSCDT